MGLFLALSGVIGASANDVQAALSEFAESRSGGFQLAKGTTDDPNIGVITRGCRNTTVLYPDGFCEWDDASKHISAKLDKSVFSLHIHDGDLWMFVLFQNGEDVGRFNPIPGYWEELPPDERVKWQGDACLITGLVPGVSAGAIAKYFVEWDLEQEDPVKAYPDDKFTICDCWQMCDFMKKIGLEYPMGDDGSILGETFRFWTKGFRLRQPKARVTPPRQKKPWWKPW
jgi:hypothetical protein